MLLVFIHNFYINRPTGEIQGRKTILIKRFFFNFCYTVGHLYKHLSYIDFTYQMGIALIILCDVFESRPKIVLLMKSLIETASLLKTYAHHKDTERQVVGVRIARGSLIM